ncbi:nitroreductase family protein [Neorhizobium petrolearium]|uniref:nitroreductase family protein n=1 Tax=Neorhizobium petrolearium TaxID=515361 RepID=UPI003F134FD8
MPVAKAAPAAAGTFARLKSFLWLARNSLYDFHRYRKSSFIDGVRSRENLEAHIRLLSHMLEYGLALSDPRAGFGMDKVRVLAGELSHYLTAYRRDATTDNGIGVLSAYIDYNAGQGADVSEARSLLDGLLRIDAAGAPCTAGSEEVSAEAIRAAASIDFARFMGARHSVRQYHRARPVEREKIERAVAAAQQSPSSCNRQTAKVLAFTHKASIARVLSHHNGNRGFGDQLGGVFVVVVDLRNWNTIGERNQGWVDGGMFAMTLALGLHAEGLGACMLNWSADMNEDRRLRKLLGLDDTQIIITLIGFGHMVERFRVPVSRRRPISQILIHEPPLS